MRQHCLLALPLPMAHQRSPCPLSSMLLFLCVYPSSAFSYVDCCMSSSSTQLVLLSLAVPQSLLMCPSTPGGHFTRHHHTLTSIKLVAIASIIWLLCYPTSCHCHCRRSHWNRHHRCWWCLSSFRHHNSPTSCSTAIATTWLTLSFCPPYCLLRIVVVVNVFPPVLCTVWLLIPLSCHPFIWSNF